MKRNVMLYLEVEVIEELQARNVNISAVVNDFLRIQILKEEAKIEAAIDGKSYEEKINERIAEHDRKWDDRLGEETKQMIADIRKDAAKSIRPKPEAETPPDLEISDDVVPVTAHTRRKPKPNGEVDNENIAVTG